MLDVFLSLLSLLRAFSQPDQMPDCRPHHGLLNSRGYLVVFGITRPLTRPLIRAIDTEEYDSGTHALMSALLRTVFITCVRVRLTALFRALPCARLQLKVS